MSKQTESERLAAELHRLESSNTDLQAEILEQCRINGMSAEREDALRAEVDRLKKAAPQAQPAREPLTDEEIKDAVRGVGLSFTAPDFKVARAIEAKLKEQNT